MNRKDDIREIAPIIIITIIGTFVFAFVSAVLVEERFPDRILGLGNTWDVQHYIRIAKHWYSGLTVDGKTVQIVFFPLYPLLIKLFSYVFQNYIVSALIVSNLAYAAAAYYLYKLVRIDFEKDDAYRTVIYFSVFPTAYFLHAGYAESLFLALTISSFYYAREGRWWLSGVLGMLAAATRITGILLIPVLLIEYLNQKEYKPQNIRPDIIWIMLIVLGLLSYLFINYQVSGDPFYFLEIQREHWNKKLSFPHEGLINSLNIAMGKQGMSADTAAAMIKTGLAEPIFALLGLALTVYSFFRLRLSYCIYALLTWLMITSTWLWLGIPRYMLAMFPVFIAMSLLGRRKWVNYLIIFISILFYGAFLSLYVRFRWTF